MSINGKIDSWQIVIKQLNELGDISVKQGNNRKQIKRCSWIIHLTDSEFSLESIYIQPIEQSLGKNGKWSKGRNIALSRLYKKGNIPNYFTDQDRELLSTIVREEYYSGWNRYGKTVYFVNNYQAIPLLKDHPHFYYDTNRDTPIAVRELSPQIDITEDKKGILVNSLSDL